MITSPLKQLTSPRVDGQLMHDLNLLPVVYCLYCYIAGCQQYGLGRPPPLIVTIRDNRDSIRVLLYSYDTTITGWGVLFKVWLTAEACLKLGSYAFGIASSTRAASAFQKGYLVTATHVRESKAKAPWEVPFQFLLGRETTIRGARLGTPGP